MEFHPGPIEGIIWKPLKKFHDDRGWLCELFRHDELPAEFHPVMAYASVTQPGIARGPHEHVDQADYFAFFGPSNFKMFLWDNRPKSKTYGAFETRRGRRRFADGADRARRRGARVQEYRLRARPRVQRAESALQRSRQERPGG